MKRLISLIKSSICCFFHPFPRDNNKCDEQGLINPIVLANKGDHLIIKEAVQL